MSIRSLRVQLLLAILTVTTGSLIAVGVFSMRTTATQFALLTAPRFVSDSAMRAAAAAAALGQWYDEHGTWRGVYTTMHNAAPTSMLFSTQGTFIAAGFSGVERATLDTRRSPVRLTFFQGGKTAQILMNDWQGLPVRDRRGRTRAELFQVPLPRGVADERIHVLARQLWVAILGAIAAALLVAAILARNILDPVYNLRDAASEIHAGNLAQRVTAKGPIEIVDLAHHFNAMAAHLQRSEQLRKRMIGDIAHELRTPLTNIRGMLEAIEDGHIPATRPALHSISEEATLLERLVNDLHDMTLRDAGQFSFCMVAVSIRECIQQAIASLEASLLSRHIKVETHSNDERAIVRADEARLRQVIVNVLSNAIRLSPEYSTISITVATSATQVKVSVADEGPGLSHEALVSAFERFYRADESRSRASGGAGLGLAIAKQIIEAFDGTIGVSNNAGAGATFWFALPLL